MSASSDLSVNGFAGLNHASSASPMGMFSDGRPLDGVSGGGQLDDWTQFMASSDPGGGLPPADNSLDLAPAFDVGGGDLNDFSWLFPGGTYPGIE